MAQSTSGCIKAVAQVRQDEEALSKNIIVATATKLNGENVVLTLRDLVDTAVRDADVLCMISIRQIRAAFAKKVLLPLAYCALADTATSCIVDDSDIGVAVNLDEASNCIPRSFHLIALPILAQLDEVWSNLKQYRKPSE